jgi:hypothetical protein
MGASVHDHLDYYLKLGMNVIPAYPFSKKPCIEWEPFQRRRATEREVELWRVLWESGYNMGFVGGTVSGNIVALDFDSEDFLKRFNMRLFMERTMVVRTGSGKYHVYVRTPNPVRTVKFLDEKRKTIVEVRGEGSFTILPPSRHPETRQSYVLLSKPEDLVTVEDPVGDLIGITGKKPEAKDGATVAATPTEPMRFKRLPPCWRALFDAGTRIEKGWRNEALIRVVSRLVQDGLPPEEVRVKALLWNEAHNVPPLDVEEAESVVRSVLRHGYTYACSGMAPFCDVRECPLYARELRELEGAFFEKSREFKSIENYFAFQALFSKKVPNRALKNSEPEHP